MKNLLRGIKNKMVELWSIVLAKISRSYSMVKPKVISYLTKQLRSLALIVLLWLQRNLNRFLQKYIDKLQPEKEIRPEIEVPERSGGYKGYEVYED